MDKNTSIYLDALKIHPLHQEMAKALLLAIGDRLSVTEKMYLDAIVLPLDDSGMMERMPRVHGPLKDLAVKYAVDASLIRTYLRGVEEKAQELVDEIHARAEAEFEAIRKRRE
jgi:hypothetical protein